LFASSTCDRRSTARSMIAQRRFLTPARETHTKKTSRPSSLAGRQKRSGASGAGISGCRKARSLATCSWAGFSSRRHRLVATPDRSRSIFYRTVTYSKGAPGEVRLDGTVSDPVACPSSSSISSRNPLFGDRSRARGISRRDLNTAVRLSHADVNDSFEWGIPPRSSRQIAHRIASAFGGEPTPPRTFNGADTS
jgi:hypothetical protein